MREVSELIYETCKTYLVTQGKFILILWIFIAVIIVGYYGWLNPIPGKSFARRSPSSCFFSIVGIARQLQRGVVRHPREHLRQLAHGVRQPRRQAVSGVRHSAARRHEHRHAADQRRAADHAAASCCSFRATTPVPCFIGFAIGESLGAAALRIAGGIFTKIADIGADLMKIVFNIKEDDARNPGVIADCTGDNAGDSVGPSADGFETYGVTGVALITFIMLAVQEPATQGKLLVWIFVMRVMMIIASGLSYVVNEAVGQGALRHGGEDELRGAADLARLAHVDRLGGRHLRHVLPAHRDLGDGTLWWKLATIITCGTLAGAIIPELVKVFTSVESSHVKEVVTSSREGGASLNILSGLRCRQLQRLLARSEHRGADEHRLSGQRVEHGDVRS